MQCEIALSFSWNPLGPGKSSAQHLLWVAFQLFLVTFLRQFCFLGNWTLSCIFRFLLPVCWRLEPDARKTPGGLPQTENGKNWSEA
jgi:hypothetical protein